MRQRNQTRRSSVENVIPEAQASDCTTMTCGGPTDAEIRQRAFAIYRSRGYAHTDPTADWLQAEQELRALANGLPAEERP